MIPRNDVLALYRLVLGRDAESEEVINEKRRSDSTSDVAWEMLKSDEFVTNSATHIFRALE